MFSENKINVSITNIIVQNGGDAAIMLGMIAALRTVWKDCFVTVFSESPEFCEKFYPDLQSGKTYGRIAVESKISHLRFIGRRYVELKKKWYLVCGWLFSKGLPMCLLPVSGQSKCSLKIYKKSDVIISCGGTYLVEHYGIDSQYIDYKIALWLKKPLFLYTQSVDHFKNICNRKKLLEIFSECKGVFLRDPRSLENVCDLSKNLEKKCRIFSDAAFALYQHKDFSSGCCKKDQPEVVFSVRAWGYSTDPSACDRYRKSMASAMEWLVEKGYSVSVLSTCQGNVNYTDDNKEADLILEFLDDEIREKISRFYKIMTPAEIIDKLKSADILIATRLHMAILGTIAGIPVLPIAYEFKTTELFKKSFQYENVLQWENLGEKKILSALEEFIINKESYRKRINSQMKFLRDNSVRAAECIKSVLYDKEIEL